MSRSARPSIPVYPIASPWGPFTLYSFFIDAPQPALIDAGISTAPADGILPALEDLGRRLEDVRWILLTHGHIDHVGGAFAAWEATGRRAEVVIHSADARLLRSRDAHVEDYERRRGRYLADPEGATAQRGMLREFMSGEMEPTTIVEGGESLDLGDGITVSVHATPGHTAGSATYILDGASAAFVGDAVQIHGAANGFPGYEDPIAYRQSLQHLLDEVAIERMYLGHRFIRSTGDPYEVDVDGRDRVAAVLRESLEIESAIAAASARLDPDDDSTTGPTEYGPFAAIAAELGYHGDPRREPSPFFTTLDGYRRARREGALR